jgi:BirA family biotin operon repressor/biotin-[acetyl-CoA-carboxylase] ligase
MPSPALGLDWRTSALQAQLAAHVPRLRVQIEASVDSTNTRLLEQARTSAAPWRDPVLIVAEQQYGGRGRHGRAWHSARAASLTFSLAWALRSADCSGLSLAVGVTLADALDPPGAAPPRIGLKWPNDLWLYDGTAGIGRKLGGILIENLFAGQSPLAVIGIGLNVLPLELADASSGVACVQEIIPDASAPHVLHRVVLPLVLGLQHFDTAGFGAFEARFRARDLLFGRDVCAGEQCARACGVASDGALLLRMHGGVQRIVGGEVSVRLRSDPQATEPTASLPAC